MKKRLVIASLVVIIPLCVITVLLTNHKLSTIPDVNFTIIDGRKINSLSLKGKPILITFWATSCTICVKEIPHLIKLYQAFDRRDFEIIAVAMPYDPPSRVIALAKRQSIPYPVALDISGEISNAFDNVQITPSSFLIDAESNIIESYIGEIDTHKLKEKVLSLQSKSRKIS